MHGSIEGSMGEEELGRCSGGSLDESLSDNDEDTRFTPHRIYSTLQTAICSRAAGLIGSSPPRFLGSFTNGLARRGPAGRGKHGRRKNSAFPRLFFGETPLVKDFGASSKTLQAS
jgi:hypothetical protein